MRLRRIPDLEVLVHVERLQRHRCDVILPSLQDPVDCGPWSPLPPLEAATAPHQPQAAGSWPAASTSTGSLCFRATATTWSSGGWLFPVST